LSGFFFSTTLIISKKLGNIHPFLMLLVSVASITVIFYLNLALCSLAMLIPCERSSLFTPFAILFMVDINGIAFLSYFLGSMFVKHYKEKSCSLIIPTAYLIIFLIGLILVNTSHVKSYIMQEVTKEMLNFQKIEDVPSAKQETTLNNKSKIAFKQSLQLALDKAKTYDSKVKTSFVSLARGGENESDIQAGFTKIVPRPGIDIIIFETSQKNLVKVIIDGDTGMIKDSYKFAYGLGEEGIEDFSDFNYGPDEAVRLIKTTEKYKKYKEKVTTNDPLVVQFKPTKKPYYWEIWTNAHVNNELYQVSFLISTKDLSIQKAILDLGKNQEIPVNNHNLPFDIDPTGGKTYFNKNYNFTIKYPSNLIIDEIDGLHDESNQLRCNFIDYRATDYQILHETVIKEQSPKIAKLKIVPTKDMEDSIMNMPYVQQEALYLITQASFPQVELRCYKFQENYRNTVEQILLTLEFTDR
jgi:hypothetical protein